MAYTRVRSSTGIATGTALILVLAFGNPSYVDWAGKHAGSTNVVNAFLSTLAWPAWAFSTKASIRDLVAQDLRAIFVVLLTAVFVMLVGRSALTGVRGTLSHLLHGWAGYIFAGAFAGLLSAFIVANASGIGALVSAETGAAYGLLVGWIVGLATLAAGGG